MIHPENQLRQGIKLRRAIQRPREYVISRAAGYHSGFNGGYNIAEAVNFALPAWLDIAETAGNCKCIRDTVKIDIKHFRRRLRGDTNVETESEDEDALDLCGSDSEIA